ncbi:MAG: MmcQ/YjbR family DNA-binding protein [Oscillospiraceae bacterium]|nr:MmcQ/YjbR family DNA-binding protein [Oscillospiraceae bacterium]
MFEEQFFKHRKINKASLLGFGFTKTAEGWQYTADVMDGQFRLHVFVTEDGIVSTKMLDSSGEEYSLYKTPSAAGAYVGEVRAACADALTNISMKCFEPDVYRCDQTHAVIEYVRGKFGDEPEFLWKSSPETAAIRRKDSRKWYGLITLIPRSKLGLDSDESAEIIDLRLKPELMPKTVDNVRYFPGWHMNKKSWYTIILDGSVLTEEIFQRIDESYALATK